VDAAMEGSIWLRKLDFERDIQSECLSDTEEEESTMEVEMAKQRKKIKAVEMLSNEQETERKARDGTKRVEQWTARSALKISFNVFILINTLNIYSRCF
jgi:hypothetical protein